MEWKIGYNTYKISQKEKSVKDNFIRYGFERVITVDKLITLFYTELSKDFGYDGESHDFWEMVYVDKGAVICTADKRRFMLKGGELTFHKPNEFHALSSAEGSAPNISIITFESKSRAMRYFDGKIIRLTGEEKALLSMLFREGLEVFSLVDPYNPLLQKMYKLPSPAFGAEQMIKNLLELFLISLHRNTEVTAKRNRYRYKVGGMEMPKPVKEIVDLLEDNLYSTLTISEIASRLGKSESSVKAMFSGFIKGGIMRYYSYLKIEEAKRLIREGKYNFSQISAMLKFDTPQYFSGCFRKFTNMSPSEYKSSIID